MSQVNSRQPFAVHVIVGRQERLTLVAGRIDPVT
jgi:hypothetical protein